MAKTPTAPPEVTALKSERQRSPNFPAVSLPEAIKRVKTVYEADKRNAIPTRALLAHLGYGASMTGSAGRMISALRQYGLLEDAGDDKYKVSDIAYKIVILSEAAPERKIAISTAAKKPAVFQTVLTTYPEGLPSDHTLRDYLLSGLRFNPASVDTFIRSLKGTLEFAKLAPEEGDGHGEEDSADDMAEEFTDPATRAAGEPPEKELLQQRVSKDCVAKVLFQGKVTQQAVAKLVAYLELMKDTLPSES